MNLLSAEWVWSETRCQPTAAHRQGHLLVISHIPQHWKCGSLGDARVKPGNTTNMLTVLVHSFNQHHQVFAHFTIVWFRKNIVLEQFCVSGDISPVFKMSWLQLWKFKIPIHGIINECVFKKKRSEMNNSSTRQLSHSLMTNSFVVLLFF